MHRKHKSSSPVQREEGAARVSPPTVSHCSCISVGPDPVGSRCGRDAPLLWPQTQTPTSGCNSPTVHEARGNQVRWYISAWYCAKSPALLFVSEATCFSKSARFELCIVQHVWRVKVINCFPWAPSLCALFVFSHYTSQGAASERARARAKRDWERGQEMMLLHKYEARSRARVCQQQAKVQKTFRNAPPDPIHWANPPFKVLSKHDVITVVFRLKVIMGFACGVVWRVLWATSSVVMISP